MNCGCWVWCFWGKVQIVTCIPKFFGNGVLIFTFLLYQSYPSFFKNWSNELIETLFIPIYMILLQFREFLNIVGWRSSQIVLLSGIFWLGALTKALMMSITRWRPERSHVVQPPNRHSCKTKSPIILEYYHFGLYNQVDWMMSARLHMHK